MHAHQWRGIRDNGEPCYSVEFDVRWREWCADGYAQPTKRRLNCSFPGEVAFPNLIRNRTLIRTLISDSDFCA